MLVGAANSGSVVRDFAAGGAIAGPLFAAAGAARLGLGSVAGAGIGFAAPSVVAAAVVGVVFVAVAAGVVAAKG